MRRICRSIRSRCMLFAAPVADNCKARFDFDILLCRRLSSSDSHAALVSSAAKFLQFVPKHDPATVADASVLANFLSDKKRLFILTGAGISTESGIPDYRGEGVGLYSTSKRRPMEYQVFIGSEEARRRYWARNYIGWPRFSSFACNSIHTFVADLERVNNIVHWVVTQNVDHLHLKAGSSRVTELHGTGSKVICLGCRYRLDRHWLQNQLDLANRTFCDATSTRPNQIRPDGDVELSDAQVASFVLPSCPQCSRSLGSVHLEKPQLKGMLKPDIVFFGENVPVDRVEFLYEKLAESDAVLVLGSSLFVSTEQICNFAEICRMGRKSTNPGKFLLMQVYSGYRFIRAAKEKHELPICIVNIGSTRGDPLCDVKINARCGEVINMMKELKYF